MEPLIPKIVTSIYEAISFAIASVFWLGVGSSIVAFVAVLVIRELPLRTTLGPGPEQRAPARSGRGRADDGRRGRAGNGADCRVRVA